MDTVKEAIRKRSSRKKTSHRDKHMKPELSSTDLDFIAEHTSIKKEDVATT